MIETDLIKKAIKNCDSRIKAARKRYKQAVEEQCCYTQKEALGDVELNVNLKAHLEQRLVLIA